MVWWWKGNELEQMVKWIIEQLVKKISMIWLFPGLLNIVGLVDNSSDGYWIYMIIDLDSLIRWGDLSMKIWLIAGFCRPVFINLNLVLEKKTIVFVFFIFATRIFDPVHIMWI